MLSFWLKFPFFLSFFSRQSAMLQCFHHHHCWMSFSFYPFKIFYYLFFVETESNRYLSALENFSRFFFLLHPLFLFPTASRTSNDFFLSNWVRQTANGFPLKFDKWFLSWKFSNRIFYDIKMKLKKGKIFLGCNLMSWENYVESDKVSKLLLKVL